MLLFYYSQYFMAQDILADNWDQATGLFLSYLDCM